MAQQTNWEAEKMLDAYIYDYLVKRKFYTTAQAFVAEKRVPTFPVAIDAPGGFLLEWWSVFWDTFIARSGASAHSAASVIQGQDQHTFWFPPQKQHQTQPSDPSNLFQLQQQLMLQAQRTRVPRSCDLDEERLRVLFSRQPLVREEHQLHEMWPVLSAESSAQMGSSVLTCQDVDLLLKQKQYLQQSHLDKHAENINCIQQQNRVIPCGGVNVGHCLSNNLSGNNHNFWSVSTKYLQKDSTTEVGRKRKECSLALHSVVDPTAVQSRAGSVSQSPATEQNKKGQPSGLYPINCYWTANLARAGSTSCLPTTVSNQTNIDAISSPALPYNNVYNMPPSGYCSEDLAYPTSASEQVHNDPFVKDSSVLQPGSIFSQIDADVGEKIIQLDIGCKGFTFSEIHHLAAFDTVECCQFSSDGKLLASGGHDKKVTLWCTDSFQIKSELGEHAQGLTDIRFSARMRWLATSSADGTVRVWDADNPGESLRTFTGHSAAVMSVDFHPLKNNFICSCDNSKEIRYWTIKNGRCAGVIKGGATCLRFQPQSGRFLATAGKNVVSVFDVETQLCRQNIQDHENTVHTLCWDSTGDHLASVSDDLVSVWRVGSGNSMECIHKLNFHGNKFHSCVFHPVHPSVLVIGCYKSLELWNMAENKKFTLDAHEKLISSLSAAGINGYVASASHDKCIKVWK